MIGVCKGNDERSRAVEGGEGGCGRWMGEGERVQLIIE